MPDVAPDDLHRVGVVAIGRNEGDRLLRCLQSLKGRAGRIVYVDSGSTDGSVAAARAAGAEVVALDMTRPFTAGRARNAGLAQLVAAGPPPEYVQFIDGDCEMQPGWIAAGRAFLDANPRAGVVCGRLRERFPERSVYNRLCDGEWNTPVGPARACGGIALYRHAALEPAGGFRPGLIAGEEPELCLRLRQAGWEVWRLADEMALHDAAMTRFGQWWQRARRGGYAAAEAVALHGLRRDGYGARLARIVIWGGLLPAAVLLGPLLGGAWMSTGLLVYAAQILRQNRRGESWLRAGFLTLAKLPEFQGVMTYLWRRLAGVGTRLIEYK